MQKWFKKTRSRAMGGKQILGYNLKMRKGDFFNLIKFVIEKQDSDVQKQWKTKVCELKMGQKMEFHFFL